MSVGRIVKGCHILQMATLS